MSLTHILHETASGYALFKRLQAELIGHKLDEVEQTVLNIAKFGKTVKLVSFAPFKNAAHALENINDVSEGVCNNTLKAFLELNLPQKKKTHKVILGVGEKNLAGSIKEATGYECESDKFVTELLRGIRLHGDKLLRQVKDRDLEKAQLGLGHSYSRCKIKFDIQRSDNMVMQSIALLDQMDKDINIFSMRLREWYGWHFPELSKIVTDHATYAKLVNFIKNKARLSEGNILEIQEILQDDDLKARQVLDAARASMGSEFGDMDMLNIENLTGRVISFAAYRAELYDYLLRKMDSVAPNLAALIGDVIGARLISRAGSLTNLSKYSASTLQVLGAEKALFRAIKTKGNTPKYGLLYHSSFVGRAGTKNKGRIARFVANRCSIASRIDCFSQSPTSKFGEALKGQVEQRLAFYNSGGAPSKNADVMKKVMEDLALDDGEEEADTKPKKHKKNSKKGKNAKKGSQEEAAEAAEIEKEGKKEKMAKRGSQEEGAEAAEIEKKGKKEKKATRVSQEEGAEATEIERKGKKEKKAKRTSQEEGAEAAEIEKKGKEEKKAKGVSQDERAEAAKIDKKGNKEKKAKRVSQEEGAEAAEIEKKGKEEKKAKKVSHEEGAEAAVIEKKGIKEKKANTVSQEEGTEAAEIENERGKRQWEEKKGKKEKKEEKEKKEIMEAKGKTENMEEEVKKGIKEKAGIESKEKEKEKEKDKEKEIEKEKGKEKEKEKENCKKRKADVGDKILSKKRKVDFCLYNFPLLLSAIYP